MPTNCMSPVPRIEAGQCLLHHARNLRSDAATDARHSFRAHGVECRSPALPRLDVIFLVIRVMQAAQPREERSMCYDGGRVHGVDADGHEDMMVWKL